MNLQKNPGRPKSLKLKYAIALTLIIIFMLCLSGLWHARNELPQGKDTFSHLNKLNIAWKMLRMQQHHYYYKYNHSYIYNLIFIVYDYPFFYYYASLLFYLFFFPLLGFKAVYVSSAFFSCVAIFFTYKTARLLLGRKEGLFAAYLCAFAPFNITNSRNFNLEMALVATICMSFYFFLRSHFFYNRKFSLLTALAASASMLTRATAAIPLAGIFIWFFSQTCPNFSQNSRKSKIQSRNFLLFVFVFLSITLIYYGNYNVLSNHMIRSFTADDSISNLLLKIQYYWKSIWPLAMGGSYIFTILFLFLLTKSNTLLRNTILFLVFIPLGIIILLPKGNLREELEWILPVLPMIPVVLSSAVKLKNKRLRNSLVIFMPLFLTLQCLMLSFQDNSSLNPFFKQVFTGKILAAQECPAYKELFDDLSAFEASNRLKIGITAETANLHFIPIFSAALDLHRKSWQLRELYPVEGALTDDLLNFDCIIIVSGNKDLSVLKFAQPTKSFIFEKTYDFHSNYFEFSEYIHLYKRKK